MRFKLFICLILALLAMPLENSRAKAESTRFQSAYHVEFGKKLLSENRSAAALLEFSQALALDTQNTIAYQELKILSQNLSADQHTTALQTQFLLELADYLNFLQTRITTLIKENDSMIQLLELPNSHSGVRENAAQTSKFTALTEGSDLTTKNLQQIAQINDQLTSRKNTLLQILTAAQTTNAQLRPQRSQLAQKRHSRQTGSRAQHLVDRIKDLELRAIRKDEIISQQSLNLALLNDEISTMRQQFSSLQTKFDDAEKRIENLTQTVASSTLEIYQRDQMLAEKEGQLVKIRKDLAELQERGSLMQRIIQEKALQSVSTESPENYSDRLLSLEQDFQKLNKRYSTLEQNLALRETEIQRLSQELRTKDDKIANLKNAYLSKEKRLDELLGVLDIYKSKLGETMKVLDGLDIRLEQFDNVNFEQDALPQTKPAPVAITDHDLPLKAPGAATSYTLDDVIQQLSGDMKAIKAGQ